ncbi:hypothetical protein JCM8097_008403, partial [Rhodosporidiobolus ruineniae]
MLGLLIRILSITRACKHPRRHAAPAHSSQFSLIAFGKQHASLAAASSTTLTQPLLSPQNPSLGVAAQYPLATLDDLRTFFHAVSSFPTGLGAASLAGMDVAVIQGRFQKDGADSVAVSCLNILGKPYILLRDIVHILEFRLDALGFDPSAFHRSKAPRRSLGASSCLLQILFEHGCLEYRREQYLYPWDAVPHDDLFLKAISDILGMCPTTNAAGSSLRFPASGWTLESFKQE